MKTCKDVMTKDPSCCLRTDSIVRAAEIMKNEDVGLVPVVEDETGKKLCGVITDRDIVLKVIAEDRERSAAAVGEVMSEDLVTCRPDDPLTAAINSMGRRKVRRIPIVDGQGRIVGIVSQADIATRVDEPVKTAEMLEDVSQPV